ncbi:hypothetical protein ENUP19_0274G0070 [Entamoeba nuttalli]|uniref:Sucrose transporter, putative n=2 Tax=Entamoeba nuttalli TaxID=412467 RepID=K2H654_ENTNP|nr:sucrose transporter, putative [Entamoeba nuttalli P19]EKE37979.1 sucrose transporter, putative [Entamoeba nuttalli P19]|eukprot:XP_008859690.1 sucrose transporter, putative [Entamoeba nuttalli P19]
MGEYTRLIFLLVLLNASEFGIEYLYAIPYASTIFKLPFYLSTIISVFIGPVIGIIVQLVIGSCSDWFNSRWGKRRPFLLLGNLIVIISIGIQVISGIVEVVSPSKENDFSTFQFIFLMIGLCLLYVGTNILQVVSRTLVLDIIPIEHQHPCALMFIALSLFARLIIHITFLIIESIDYTSGISDKARPITVLVLYSLAILIVPLTSTITFFTATESFIPADRVPLFIFIKSCLKSILAINRYTVCNWLILLFGWMSFVAFDSCNTELFHFYNAVFYEKSLNIITPDIMSRIQSIIFALAQLGYCIYMLTKKQYPWYMMSISNAITSLISFLPLTLSSICFYSSIRIELLNSSNLLLMMSLSCIFIIPVAFSSAQLLSIPFALLKNIVPSSHFGLFVGIFNCGIIFSQQLLYGLNYAFFESYYSSQHTITMNDFFKHKDLIPIFCCISILLYLITSIAAYFIRWVYNYHDVKDGFIENTMSSSESDN